MRFSGWWIKSINPSVEFHSGGSDDEPDWMRDFEEKKPASDAVEAKAKKAAGKVESKKVK